MSWALTETDRLRVLWRLHLLLVALRSEARQRRNVDLGLDAITSALQALMGGDIEDFERRLEASAWAGASWTGATHGGSPVVDARVAVGFVEALLAGCRAAVGASSEDLASFADSMEYIPAARCDGAASALGGLDVSEEPELVRVVGARLRDLGLP